ncbi:PKD domain-containing protein [Polluticoccus soli]|uniref:DUF7948 domain-containing protein n=2 Tax=Bacteria TaxID=2 RepID=UPI0023E31575|nr:PKD domain-containing protein [Flavipsychrobacter sp. JY13-12]
MRQKQLLVCLLLLSPYLSGAHEGHSSIEFVENKGQWKEPFLYKATTAYGNIFLEKDGFMFSLSANENASKINEFKHGHTTTPPVLKYHAYKVSFVGAQIAESVTGSKAQKHYYNYFLGNSPSHWRSEIHPVYNVDYHTLYNGIDLHVSSENSQLKYDFIVQPGADASQIKLNYDGATSVTLKENNLNIETSVGTVNEMAPYAYQYINDRRVEVQCRYKLEGNTVSYSFPKGYNKSATLVIDPNVVFATFTGSSADNWGFTATYDALGNFYAGGIAFAQGYPLKGAYDATFNTGGGTGGGNGLSYDMSVTKFDPSGAGLVYSTYIGGADNEQPHSMVVDGAGNLIIAGRAYSSDYPTANAYDASYAGGADIIVTKLNAAGTALIGSTFFGGADDDGVNISSLYATTSQIDLKHSYADDARSEVIVDNAGNIYVASCTRTATGLGIGGTYGGGQDGVVLKFNSNLSSLIGGSYIGGVGEDAAYVLALDKAQTTLYVGGGVTNTAFSTGVTSGSYAPNYKGGIADGYIAKFQNAGAPILTKATYIGSASYDQVFGVQLDDNDDVYAMGNTLGKNTDLNPTTTWSNPGAPQFVIKLANTLAGPPIFITRFGDPSANAINISPVAFLIDTCQHIYISGWGGSTAGNGSSTANMPVDISKGVTPSGIISSTTDGSDFYFIAISKNSTSLLFAGYYGGNALAEHVDGGTSRFDRNGVIYQAICGNCGTATTGLPMTSGAWSTSDKSTNCNLAAIKIEFNLGAVNAKAKADPDGVVCLGESIQFKNSSTNAQSYEWDFGDGSPISTAHTPPPHTYGAIGKYKVRLITVNPDACKTRDTDYVDVTVDTIRIKVNFSVEVTANCNPYKIQITNHSQYSKTPNAPSITQFIWDFGDGKTGTGANPNHDYPDTGTYVIRVTMIDTTACNSPDTMSQVVKFQNFLVKAGFELPPVCERNNIPFPNKSSNAAAYIWNFGDGDTSHAESPMHKYDTAGNYTVTLYAINDASCNRIDSFSQLVVVKGSPHADFDYTPKIFDEFNVNDPVVLTNKTLGGDVFEWNFGDNTGSNKQHPEPHFYKKTGSYTVCLMTKNSVDCWDTVCKRIDALVEPIVDIPTGFSPNGDGNNDVLYVRGGAIEKVTLRVYNRWGQLVFEAIDVQANDPAYGWDGSFKGKQQEMEVYGYVMSGIFITGDPFYKKGNVTLIR